MYATMFIISSKNRLYKRKLLMMQQANLERSTQHTRTPIPHRARQLRLGVGIELITVIWMTIEASIAIITGYITHSVSLQGFGIDSIIELLTGGVLLWRLLV